MKKRFIFIVSGMLVMALLGAALGAKLRKKDMYPAFTLKSMVTHFVDDGRHIVERNTTYAFSDGSWHTVLTDQEGVANEYFFKAGQGFFVVNHKSKVLKQSTMASQVASPEPPPLQTAEELRKHPQFVNTEKLLGFTAYLIRVKDEQTGLPVSDLYYVVELGTVPVKLVEYDEGKPTFISEPISVTFGEPPDTFSKLPDYVVAN